MILKMVFHRLSVNVQKMSVERLGLWYERKSGQGTEVSGNVDEEVERLRLEGNAGA